MILKLRLYGTTLQYYLGVVPLIEELFVTQLGCVTRVGGLKLLQFLKILYCFGYIVMTLFEDAFSTEGKYWSIIYDLTFGSK